MKLPLESITVLKRRREDFGDIAGLAESIQTYGLFHPIVVDDEGTLVAGERRLRAVQSLGWESVEVRDLGELTEAERNEIELEENSRRKDLTPYERSKTLARLAETARTVLLTQFSEPSTKDDEPGVFTESVKTPGGRPPKNGVPIRAVADRIGVPPQTIREAQQHVAAAERYPELQAPEIPQRTAIEVAKSLDVLPESEREERRRTVDLSSLNLPSPEPPLETKTYFEIMRRGLRWADLDVDLVSEAHTDDYGASIRADDVDHLADWLKQLAARLRARGTRGIRAVK